MTPDQARQILLLYRPGTTDEVDPEIVEALALARKDPELARWLEQHVAQQEKLRARVRQIPAPTGLKEQIISERLVHTQQHTRRRVVLLAVAAVAVGLMGWRMVVSRPAPLPDDTFAHYCNRMVSTALRGYAMGFSSGDLAQIRAYLARQKTAEDFVLPAGLQKVTVTGCAIEDWQGAKVAMICFRTGQPLPPGATNNLWLFVVERADVKGADATAAPRLAKVNWLMTATWTRGDKLYLLGAVGDQKTIEGLL